MRYLAIDLGAESGRGVVGHLEGGRLTLQEVHRFPNTPVRLMGSLHWNALELYAQVKQAIGHAAQGSSAPLAGIAVDSWGVDYGLVGAGPRGGLIGLPYHYRDGRTDGVMERALGVVPREEIFEHTGIQFLQFNTLYQLIAAKEEHPRLLEVAERLLMIGELMTYFLTGRAVAEFTNATTTQLFDPRQGGWATDLFRRFGLPIELMPEVVQPGSVVGTLLADVAEEIGCGTIPVIVPAVHDTGSAVAGVPAQGKDWAFISSGTWSLVGVEVETPVISQKSLEYNLTNEGGVAGTYRLLKNVMGLWLLQECRRSWQREGDSVEYADLTAEAEAAQGFRGHVDPDDPAFFKPGEMPERIMAHLKAKGEPLPQTRGEMVRCILESLALKYRYVIEGLEETSGRKIEVIHVVGGGSQNRLLNQMTADATGRRVIAGPVEATATGNIIMQAVGTEALADLAAGRAVVRNSFELDVYEPKETAAWDEAYQRFLRGLTQVA